jgi:hypothetical protein
VVDYTRFFKRKNEMMTIKIVRYTKSLNYMRDATAPLGWYNNDANNCQDDYIVMWGDLEIFRAKVQTVANMEGLDCPEKGSPSIKFKDTIAVGPFLLKAFVEQRNFYGRIHGICDAFTLSGDYIGMDSTTSSNKSRWLNHDDQKHRLDATGKPVAPGTLTRVKWSAGCFVMPMAGLAQLGTVFDQYGILPGQLIPGNLTLAP